MCDDPEATDIDPVLQLAHARRLWAQAGCEPCKARLANQIRALEARLALVSA